MSLEIGSVDVVRGLERPAEAEEVLRRPRYAIQLSMIVVITSCAPTVALRKPAIPAQTAPASVAAATIASRMCAPVAMLTHDEPIQIATYSADEVLALAADVEHAAAERERDREPGEDQRRRDRSSVCAEVVRGRAVRPTSVVGWKSQLRPAPLKIVAVGR